MTKPRLFGNDSGGILVEFAMTLPIFLLLLIGSLELGTLLFRSAGMKHGINAAARDATLYPTPPDDQLKKRAIAAAFGIEAGRLNVNTTRGEHQEKGKFVQISGVYESVPLTSFTGLRSQQLTEVRLVWLQDDI